MPYPFGIARYITIIQNLPDDLLPLTPQIVTMLHLWHLRLGIYNSNFRLNNENFNASSCRTKLNSWDVFSGGLLLSTNRHIMAV